MRTSGPDGQIDYYGIFNQFAQAMHDDFVDFQAARDTVSHLPYMEAFGDRQLAGEGYAIQFVQYLSAYLLAFRNPAVKLGVDHARLPFYPAYTWGFRTRAYGDDALYVTDALPGSGFAPGQRIEYGSVYSEPSFRPIPVLRKRFGRSLGGDAPEREAWDPLLHFVNRYLVANDDAAGGAGGSGGVRAARVPGEVVGQTDLPGVVEVDMGRGLTLRVSDGTRTHRVTATRLAVPAPRPPFELARVPNHDGALLLTLRDLSDAAALSRFVGAHAGELGRAAMLVIDARDCAGGLDDATLPLLPYVVGAPTVPAAFMEPTCLTNYTRNNVRRQCAALDLLAGRLGGDGEALRMVAQEKEALAGKAGAGLVEEPCDIPDACQEPVAPAGGATIVRVLTDVGTVGAAELLAEVARASDRALTVGRATRGARGYFNPAAFASGPLSLTYPTSRFTDEGLARHFHGVGVPADVPVPWTPEGIGRDVDLEAALH